MDTRIEDFRIKGNDFFRAGKIDNAIREYTNAVDQATLYLQFSKQQRENIENNETNHVDVRPNVTKNLILSLQNRSLCYIRIEDFRFALEDATAAIDLNKDNPKGYYRRGCAYLCLCRYKEALQDFQVVAKISSDPEALCKLKECKQFIAQEKFANAIATGLTRRASEKYDREIVVDDTYNGPILEAPFTNTNLLQETIDYISDINNKIHKKYIINLLLESITLLSKLPSLVNINISDEECITICGDTHGQFYDLKNIFEINGLPSKTNPYLFNGDFVDRGSFSVEVITTLLLAKMIFPDHVHLTRGNHETTSLNSLYGFHGEVNTKYNNDIYDLFSECFRQLPLACVINDKVFVVHGGLPSDDYVTLEDIRTFKRDCEPAESGIMTDLLWSDPQLENGRTLSKRGVSFQFGPDISKEFCRLNKLDYIVRSHEMKMSGYEEMHDGRVITIFSAPNYCDSMGNSGALVKLVGAELKKSVVYFDAKPHPLNPSMRYANPLLSFMQ